jgi:hypothetical protein
MKNKSKEASVLLRLPKDWIEFIRALKGEVGFSQQQMLEDAVVLWAGKPDPVAAARRKMVLEVTSKGKVRRPFNSPLTPFNNNALTAIC